MYETFKRMSEQLLFLARNADPYAQSHPMPAERVAALADFARTSPYWDKKDDTALQLRHDLMRAKISGFMERPDTVLRRYPMSNDSLPARYARAIAGYKHGDLRNADRPDRRAAAGAAEQSLLLRAARPGAAGRRAAERGDRAAAQARCSSPTTRR